MILIMSDACTINVSKPSPLSSIMMVGDAPRWGVTYDYHSDGSTGSIYDRNMFIVQPQVVVRYHNLVFP